MIVKLQGGLGNQMFQVAYGMTRGAKFDRSGIVPPRTYALDPFKLPIEFEDNAPDAEVGYWQSEKWFKGKIAWDSFSKNYVPYTNTCMVHIRLTDNLSERALAFHGNLLETDYYQKAMEYMKSKVPNVTFLIFSDDPDLCKSLFRVSNADYVPKTTDYDHLMCMSCCPYAIIANSSFSWWGAWLSPEKIVVTPKRWFVVDVPGADEIVPERWVRL